MSAPRGLGRRFLAVFLSFSLLPLPPAGLIAPVFAEQLDQESDPPKPTVVASAALGQPALPAAGVTPGEPPAAREDAPANPDAAKLADVLKAFAATAAPLKEAALASDAVKAMSTAYAAALKALEELSKKAADDKALAEAKKRAEALSPLVEAKSVNAELRTLTAGLEETLQRSPSDPAVDWKKFDAAMARLGELSGRAESLGGSAKGRGAGPEGWGDEPPPADVRRLHAEAAAVLAEEYRSVSSRWRPIRDFSLARPGTVTGDTARRIVDDLAAGLPEAKQPDVARKLSHFTSDIAGLAQNGASPEEVNGRLRTLLEGAGVTGERLESAMQGFSQSARRESANLSPAAIPPGLLTDPRERPFLPGEGPGKDVPTPDGAPKPAGPALGGLQFPQRMNAASVAAGRTLLAMLPAPTAGATLTDAASLAFSSLKLAFVPPLLAPTAQERLGSGLSAAADFADRQAAGLRRERGATEAEAAAAKLEAAAAAPAAAGLPAAASLAELDAKLKALREDPALAALPEAERAAYLSRLDAMAARARAADAGAQKRRADSAAGKTERSAAVDELLSRVETLKASGAADWEAQASAVAAQMAALRKKEDQGGKLLDEDAAEVAARWTQLRQSMAGWMGGRLPAAYGSLSEEVHALISEAPDRLGGASPADVKAWQARAEALRLRLFGDPKKGAAGREASDWARLEALADGLGPDGPEALAAARARAGALRGLLEAMKQGGVDPTTLPPEMKALFLGTVRESTEKTADGASGRLGLLGQALMAQKGRGDSLNVLMAAIEKNVDLDSKDLEGDLAKFFENVRAGKVSVVYEGSNRTVSFAGTSLEPVIARFTGAKAPAEGPAPDPAAPAAPAAPAGPSSAGRDLVAALQSLRGAFTSDADRARAQIYLSHDNLNRSVYDYLKALPADAPERAQYKDFITRYEGLAAAGFSTRPGLEQIRAQQDVTDLARGLLSRFPEQEALARSNQATLAVQAGFVGLDPAAAALLAANGSPDLANLRDRNEKQGVLQAGIAAYGLKLNERDPAAWAAARDQLLTYFYGSGYDASVKAQRNTMREAAAAGDTARMAQVLDGVVAPAIRTLDDKGKPELSLFITSGFLKQVPGFLERRAAGTTTARDQSLAGAWEAVAERMRAKGMTAEQVTAAAADPAALATALRGSGVPVYDRALLDAAAGRGTPSPEAAAALTQAAAMYGVKGDPLTDADARKAVLAAMTADLGGAKADAVEQARRDQLLFTSTDETRDHLRKVEAAADRAGGAPLEGLVAGMKGPGEGAETLPQLRARQAAFEKAQADYGLRGKPSDETFRDLAWGMLADRARLAQLAGDKSPAAEAERTSIMERLRGAERFAGVDAQQRQSIEAAVRTESFRSLVSLRDALTAQRIAGDDLVAEMGRLTSSPGGAQRQALAGNFFAVRSVTGAALRDREVPIKGLRASGWVLGYDNVYEIVRRPDYVSGDGTAANMGERAATNNKVAGASVKPPALSTRARDGLAFYYDDGVGADKRPLPTSARTWRYESLDGKARETHAPEVTRLPDRFGDKPVEVYRDREGRTVYRVQGTSDYFWLPPDPSIPVTKVDPKAVGLRRVEKLTVETRESTDAAFTAGTLTYYRAQAGDKVAVGEVYEPPHPKAGQRVRASQGAAGASLIAYEQQTAKGSIRVDYENGTQFVREGDRGWSFALSADYSTLAESRSRTVIDLSGGQSKVLYTEFLQKGEKDGKTTWTLMRSDSDRDAASRSTVNNTIRIGDRTAVSWADFDAQSRRDFQNEAEGRTLARRGENKLESVGVSFDRKPGEAVSEERMRAAAAMVRSRLAAGDEWLRRGDPRQRDNGAYVERDFADLMKMFDGERGRGQGTVSTYDVSYSFSGGSGKGAERAGVSASVTMSRYDAANGRTSQASRNFTYTDFSQLPTDPDKFPTDPSGPGAGTSRESPQLKDARLQAHGTLRLLGIRDFTQKPGALVEYTEASSRTGADGKQKTVMIASSFLHNGRLYGVSNMEGESREVGGNFFWAGDRVRDVYIKDDRGNEVWKKDYKVGETTSMWNAARHLGDYTSGAIRYTDFGERNPIGAAILGGIAGGLIEGLGDPMNLVMMGGIYGVGKVALSTAKATSRTLKTVNTVARTILRAAPVGMRVMMAVQGGVGTFNLGYGLATGNADMVANGTRGLTMLLPLQMVYEGAIKVGKSALEKPKIPEISTRVAEPTRPREVGAKSVEPTTPHEPPARVQEPPAKVQEPPAKVQEPPAKVQEPPARVQEPPARVQEPPAKVQEPPARVQEPPARVQEPPARVQEPPARVQEPPAKPQEPPVRTPDPSPAPAPSGPSGPAPRLNEMPSMKGGFENAGNLSHPNAGAGELGPVSKGSDFFGSAGGKGNGAAPAAAAPVAAAPAAPHAAPAPAAPAAAPKAPEGGVRPAAAPAAPTPAARPVEAPGAAPGRPIEPPAQVAGRANVEGQRPLMANAMMGAPPPSAHPDLPTAMRGFEAPEGALRTAPVREPVAAGRAAAPAARPVEAPKAAETPMRVEAPARAAPAPARAPEASPSLRAGEPVRGPEALRAADPVRPKEPLSGPEPLRTREPAPETPRVSEPAPAGPSPAPSAVPKDADLAGLNPAPSAGVGSGGAHAAAPAPAGPGPIDRFLLRLEGVGAKHMPTFAKAAAAPSKGLERLNAWADLAPARFAAANPGITKAWRQTTGVLNAPFHALGALGARVSAWGEQPGRSKFMAGAAEIIGAGIQGVRADGKHAMSREETLHPRVQDRAGFQEALKGAEFTAGEATLYAKADPVTGRITEYSAAMPPHDGRVLLEIRVERGPQGDRVADLAVSPVSRVEPTRFAAERFASAREVSTLDLPARLEASRLVRSEDFKARILEAAKADPVDRVADVSLKWDAEAGRWRTEGEGPGMRLILEPDAKTGTYRLAGAQPTGPLPEHARLTLETALQSELSQGLDLPRAGRGEAVGPRLAVDEAGAAWTAADKAFRTEMLAAKGDFGKASMRADAELAGLRERAATPEGRAAYEAALARHKEALKPLAEALAARGGDAEYAPLARARMEREAAWNRATPEERIAAVREADARYTAAANEAAALGLTNHARAEGTALRVAAAEAVRKGGGDPLHLEARERLTQSYMELEAARGTAREPAAAARAAAAEADAALLVRQGARIDVDAERALVAARREPETFAALEPGLRARTEAAARREAASEAALELARLGSVRESRVQARERAAAAERELSALGVDPKKADALDAARLEARREFARARAEAEAAPKERAAEAWDRSDAAYAKARRADAEAAALLERAGAGKNRAHDLLEARAAARDELARAGDELLPAALARRVAAPQARGEADFAGALRAAAEADARGRKQQGYRMREMTADMADKGAVNALREARGLAARGESYGRGGRTAYQGEAMTCSLHAYANQLGVPFGEVEGLLRARLGEGFIARVEQNGLSPGDIRRVGQLLAAEKGVSFELVAPGEVFARAAKGERFGVIINAEGAHMASLERVTTDRSGQVWVEFKDSMVRGDGRPVKMRLEDFVPLLSRTPAVALGARKASAAELASYREGAAPLLARHAPAAGAHVGAGEARPAASLGAARPGDEGPAPRRGLSGLFDRLNRSVETNAVTERAGRSNVEGAPAPKSAYEALPRSLLDVAEGYYAVTMKAATPAELAKMDRTSEADPAWWSDHGPNHVRNIVENMAAIIKQAPASGLIAERSALRADFMEKAGGVSAALHDMWMKDLTGRGRKLHPSRASREAFSAGLDKAAADLEGLKMADGREFGEVLRSEYGVPPGEVSRVTREIMAMSYAHSKSNVPLETLNDPMKLRQAMVDVTTSRDGATAKIKADEGVRGEALPGELQPYRRFYERDGADAFDRLAFDWVTDNPKLAADVTDLSRALRVADALRWRGSADFRGSQGSNIGIARLGENPRTYMRLSDPQTGKTYMVVYDSKLAMGEANIRTAQMTEDGGLRFAFESGRFGSAAGDAKVAEGTAHVLFDVYKDYVMSFNKVGDRPIVLERPRGESPGFTERVVEGLQSLAKAEKDPFFAADIARRLAEGKLVVREAPAEDAGLLKDLASARELEEKRFLDARPYRPNADSLNALAKMADASGVDVSRIDFKHALEGARVVTLEPGETLLARGSPAGYVYIPLSEGLSVRLGQGYKAAPLKAGAPVGELSALAQAPRNADIAALPAGAPGAKPTVSVLAISREVYLREWTRGYYDHSTILPRLKRDYAPGELAGRERAGTEVGAGEPIRDVWAREREALAARLASARGIDAAAAAKAIDAHNRSLGLSADIFAGHPDGLASHFARMGGDAEFLGTLPKGSPKAAPAAPAPSAAGPRAPPADTAHPVGALQAVDAALSRPGALEKAATDPALFKKAADALLTRVQQWRAGPDGAARRASGGMQNLVTAQGEYSAALLKGAREYVAKAGLDGDKVITNGTTLDALLGIVMAGRIEATNPHRGFSGESAQVWGAHGLEGGASYGAKRGVGRDQPGVLLIIDNPKDPIRVVGGETLSRAPVVGDDIKAAIVSDGRRTFTIEGEALRALSASAERWRGAVNERARAGDMSEFTAYDRLQRRLSAEGVSKADYGGRGPEVGAGERGRGDEAAGRARSATDELVASVKRARSARPDILPEGTLLHGTSEAALRRIISSGKMLPSVGKGNVMYGEAVYAEVFSASGAEAIMGGPLYALRTYGRQAAVEAARAGSPDHRPVLLRISGESIQRPSRMKDYIDGAPITGSAPLSKSEVRALWEKLPLAEQKATSFEAFSSRFKSAPEGLLARFFGAKESGAGKVGAVPLEHLEAFDAAAGRWVPAKDYRFGRRSGGGEVGAAERPALERYFSQDEFRRIHPKEEDVYHDWQHSLKVGDMAYDFAVARNLDAADAKLVREIALLHDIDPSRAPGAPARVPATLEALHADFAGKVSLTGEAGRSLLRERFGWGERELRLAEAMIQRTEFPFADSHPNPFYKEASPLARYEAMLRALPEADRAFALREGALLSEYADKSSWYATEPFPGAMKVVEGLAHEINTASGGKAQMTASKLDTAAFLSVLGEPKSFELDLALARRLGMAEPSLPNRAEAWRLLGGEYGARFEANVKGFAAYKESLSGGASHEAASALGGERAAAEFTTLRAPGVDAAGRAAREPGPDVGGVREAVGRLAAVPGRVAKRAWTEAFGDAGGRLYFTRTLGTLIPYRGAADMVLRRAVRATLEEPGSVVGVLEGNRIDTQRYSDCSVRANYNHPALAPVREVLPYEDFLRLNEALVGARLRDTGTYHFQKGHVLQALGFGLGGEWSPTSASELAGILRSDGAVFGTVNFKMPRPLSPTDTSFVHAIVVNGGIHEKSWGNVLAAASERGWAKTAWDMLRAPRETLRTLKDDGVWRFVVTDSNFSRPQLYTFSELKAMNLETSSLVSRPKRVPGAGYVEMTAADHMRRAAELRDRLKDVEVPHEHTGRLLDRLTIGRQAKVEDAPVLMRADRKAELDIEGWAGVKKHLEVLPAREAVARFKEIADRFSPDSRNVFVVDPANPRQFTLLAGEGDAVTLGRRGDGNFRWPLGVKNEVVRLSYEADGLRVERLDTAAAVKARGARLKVLEAAGAETAGRAPAEGAEVGAGERPKAADVWRQEREGLAARLAAERGVPAAAALKAIDAFNAELGLGPGIFAGMPDRVSDHFGRMAENPDLLARLPKGAPAATPAAGTQAAGRAAGPDLAPLAQGLRPADPAKLENMTAAFPVVDAQGKASYLKTAFYRGSDFDGALRQNARIEDEALKTAALKRDFSNPALAPQAPAPAGVRLPEVLGFGIVEPRLARALYGASAPEIKGVQLETLPGRLLQAYMDMESGAYRRADGSPVMTRADFARLEAAVKRMHALGRGWGDFHDGQVLVRGEPGRLEFGLIDFGTLHARTGPADAKFREIVSDDLARLADLKTALFGEPASGGARGFEVGAGAAADQAPSAAAKLHGRLNIALGKGFYHATGGSFGILPKTFGRNADGDPLIILERKTLPFSQLLPAALRPEHYLSIGVNAAPDLASKKALIKAFSELTAPETLKALGVGERGGAKGFKVVTENPALVAFAKRYEKDGWKVTPYEEGTGALDKVQHWLQHPFASARRLGERLLGVTRPDGRHIISREFAPERAALEAPLPADGALRALPGPAAGVLPLPEAPGNFLRGVRGAGGENLLNAPNSPRSPPADVGAVDPKRLFGTPLTGRFNQAANHIREEGYITKTKQGVKGAHDAQTFESFLNGKGQILSNDPVPGLDGVSVVQYKMFRKRADGSVTAELQSGAPKRKTTFDPAIWTPERLEALAETVFSGVELRPAGFPTEVKRGKVTFVGFRDRETGGLATFGVSSWEE